MHVPLLATRWYEVGLVVIVIITIIIVVIIKDISDSPEKKEAITSLYYYDYNNLYRSFIFRKIISYL